MSRSVSGPVVLRRKGPEMKPLQNRLHVLGVLVFTLTLLGAGGANALPALQLGPGAGNWTYDTVTGTWVAADDPLQLAAYANAASVDGGNGDYAWPNTTDPRVAYLVVSATPKSTSGGDLFDISLANDATNITLSDSGYGTPPIGDSNSLAPHGVFDTYFEIYAFDFDGSLTTIYDTQPGETGSGMGYVEYLDITINSLADGLTGLHFDLFTLGSADQVSLESADQVSLEGTDQVYAFAPFSHDGAYVPEPSAAVVFSVGLLLVGRHLGIKKRKAF